MARRSKILERACRGDTLCLCFVNGKPRWYFASGRSAAPSPRILAMFAGNEDGLFDGFSQTYRLLEAAAVDKAPAYKAPGDGR